MAAEAKTETANQAKLGTNNAEAAQQRSAADASAGSAMMTMAELQEAARASLAGEAAEADQAKPGPNHSETANNEQAENAEATEETEAGQESPPADETEVAEAQDEAVTQEGEEGEPTAEEQANWTDGEKRLYGALQKEREESKTARAELRELKSQFTELKGTLDKTKEASATDTTQSPRNEPAPSAATALADCNTFEAVDARVAQAAEVEMTVTSLQNKLARNQTEAVVKGLQSIGVTHIGGMPVAEMDAEGIGNFLDKAQAGAKATQSQAAPRKQFIASQVTSWRQAVEILPEMDDVKSDVYKGISALVARRPSLKTQVDWPMVAAKLWLGEQESGKRITAKAAAKTAATTQQRAATPQATTKTTTAKPAAKQAPGASRRAAAAAPATDRLTALQGKMEKGTASMAEMQEYTRLNVGAE